jgi:hypothetical protein
MSSSTEKLLRVRAALPGYDPALSSQVASILQAVGFRVDEVSPRGVGFAGTTEQIEQAFGCSIEPRGRGHVFAQCPRLPEPLKSSGVNIYLPTPPDYHH